jgi:DNA-binding NtrC family response regulator
MDNPKPRPRVTVIDDEQIIADTLAEILKLHGYEAKAHYSGESALADAKEFCPHVVLSDIHMQKIDGIETALRFRESQPECRIILFTASPMSGELYERISHLGFEFLQRPLHPLEVVALLREDASVYRAPATGELLGIRV